MSRHQRPSPRALARSALWAFLIGATPGPSWAATTQAVSEDLLALETFDAVWTTVRDRHYDPEHGGVDWDAVGAELRPHAERAASKNELRDVLRRMLARLGQSHFAIIDAELFQGGADTGLGDEDDPVPPGEQTWDTGSGFSVRTEAGKAYVASVDAKSKVGRAGIKEGWSIEQVGDTPIVDCEYSGDVTRPILMEDGEEIQVTFRSPAGKTVPVDLFLGSKRSRTYQFAGMPATEVVAEFEWVESDIGYFTFNGFFDPVLVMSQFQRAMGEFMDATGIILDVRGNGGGMGSMAVAMCSWFVEEEGAVLGILETRESHLEATVQPRMDPFFGSLAVLIDGASGSSSEIFAANLRDLAGARLFGARTAGAVLPSAFDQLPNGDYLQYVVASYATGSGEILEGVGVAPDVETKTRRTEDPQEDEALQAAIRWIYEVNS